MTALAVLAALAWAYLLLAHGRFWQGGPVLAPARPGVWPDFMAQLARVRINT